MAGSLSEQTWTTLLDRIKRGACTPFLGAGACFPYLPLGREVAQALAEKYRFPFGESNWNLPQVAQYVAVTVDPLTPKEDMLRMLESRGVPDFKAAGQPHAVLADLPIPIYLTTNYDDFMSRALKRRYKDARQEYCRWTDIPGAEASTFDSGYVPTVANPVVYHLHGFGRPETLVLTEDDYLEFLTNMADPNLLPKPVKSALGLNTCLFIGYGFADWNFRILFQALRSQIRSRMNVAVLYLPDDVPQADKQREYFQRQYSRMGIQIYWGTATDFCTELQQRWKALQ